MPNHIINRIHSDNPKVFTAVWNALVRLDEEEVDFNVLVPEPDPSSHDWYDWRIRNWGTKWNAYEQDSNPASLTIEFQTAWSAPDRIIDRLAETVPGPWWWVYADEDIGNNCGTWSRTPTEGLRFHSPSDPTAHACSAWGMAEDEYRELMGLA